MCGLRQRKKEETRERIAIAAVELLSSEGQENATVANIAQRAGVSPRTFHNYFPHREDAFYFFFETLVQRWINGVKNAPPEEPSIALVKRLAVEEANLPDDDSYSTRNVVRLIDYTAGILEPELLLRVQSLFRELGEALHNRGIGDLGKIESHVVIVLSFLAGGIALKMHEVAPCDDVLQVIFRIFEHGVNGQDT